MDCGGPHCSQYFRVAPLNFSVTPRGAIWPTLRTPDLAHNSQFYDKKIPALPQKDQKLSKMVRKNHWNCIKTQTNIRLETNEYSNIRYIRFSPTPE